jgi:rRNA processing protein Gar1
MGKLKRIKFILVRIIFTVMYGLVSVALQVSADPVVKDKYEPNEDLLHPAIIKVNSVVKGTIDPARDVDVYKFHLPSNKRELIEIKLLNPTQNLALNFIVYDQNREEIGWVSSKRGAAESKAQLTAELNQDYYIVLYSSTYGIGGKYSLESRDKERSAEYYTMEIKIVTADDKYEPNEDLLHPAIIESDSIIKGAIDPARDVDVYKFHLPSNKRELIEIKLLNPTQNLALNFILYDQNKEEIGWVSSKRGAAESKAQLTAEPNQDYYIILYSSTYGIGGKYSLESRDKERSGEYYTMEVKIVTVSDKYEPNEDLLHPAIIKLDSTIKGTIDPTRDVDVYKFHISSNKKELIDIKLFNPTQNLALNFIVYNQNKEEIGWVSSKRGAAEAKRQLTAEPNQDYYIVLYSSTYGIGGKYSLESRDKKRSGEYYTLNLKLSTVAK